MDGAAKEITKNELAKEEHTFSVDSNARE